MTGGQTGGLPRPIHVSSPLVASADPDVFTPAHVDLLAWMAQGAPMMDVAKTHGSTVTVMERMTRRLLTRLGTRSLPHAVGLAYELGVLVPAIPPAGLRAYVLAACAGRELNAEVDRRNAGTRVAG